MTVRNEGKPAEAGGATAHSAHGAISRRGLLALAGAAGVAACTPTTSGGPAFPNPGTLPVPTGPAVTGETLGTGSVRVALLLPKSGQGNGPALASAMQNAASLGLNDFTANDLTILVKDSGGTAGTASAAAQAAISEGAELIIGPVFAAEVGGVGPVARAANVPVVAFSSDPSVAASGVYLLGFLIDGQAQRVLAQAASAGKRSVAGIISTSAFGNLAEAALRQAAGRYGLRLAQVERFNPGDQAKAVAAVAANSSQIDCLFVPEGPGIAPQIAQALRAQNVDLGRVKLLGTGVWNDPSVYGDATLAGGWFPSPEISGFANFAGRYRSSFGAEPPLTASLAYDAVVLAAGLVKTAGAQRFQLSVLTNPQGFLSSVNGLFRFNANGTNDRGLAVYEVTGSSPSLVSPAPRAFTGA
ncbi:penicillin-binding protein activator [Oryzibacter oryziterrae]|uniref:penicillin-binding protein activator n=1 Tax=Oryzibacter oryziterrae TaxID=2766474 RepID=UPI001F453904|nr:penicillin-binding protein activator [Oryzibacter oryziterrae]